MEGQIASLRATFEDEEREMIRDIEEERDRDSKALQEQIYMARSRKADDPPNGSEPQDRDTRSRS